MKTQINSLNIRITSSRKFETFNLCFYLLQQTKNRHLLIKNIRKSIYEREKERRYNMSRAYEKLNIVKFHAHTFENPEGVVLQLFVKVILFNEVEFRSKMSGILKFLRNNLYELLYKTGLAPDNKLDIYIIGKEKFTKIAVEEIDGIFSLEKKFNANNYSETILEKKLNCTRGYKIIFSIHENIYDVISLVLLMVSYSFLFGGPNSIVNVMLRIKHRSIYNYYTDMCLVDNSIYFSFQIDQGKEEIIQELITTIENGKEIISENSLKTIKKTLRNVLDNLSDNPEAAIDFSYKYKCDISNIYQFNEVLSFVTLEQLKSYLSSVIIIPNKSSEAAIDV